MRCWHTHTAPGKDYRVMQYTHASDCSLVYLQSPLQYGNMSELLWHARFHLGCVKGVAKLRSKGVAKNYGSHVQEGHPFPCHLPRQNVDTIIFHAYV